MAKTFDHSAPPFNPTIQRRTIGHRKMSQVFKHDQHDMRQVYWYQDQPHMSVKNVQNGQNI